jgi:DNA transformation protein
MDAEHIRELFSQFKSVEVRRMFGGVGISAEGLTFAIAFEGVIYLRANSDMVPDLKELGSKPFVYPYAKHPRTRKNPDAAPFWKMPEHLYDDPVEAARWAQRSLDAARAKKTGKAKTAPRRPRSRKAVLARKSTGRKSRTKETRPKSAARKAAPKQRTTGKRTRRR